MNCGYQCDSVLDLENHKKSQHTVSFECGQTCKVEKNKKERDYKLLQANYERLIELNKDLQIEAKDRNYSVEIQLKELKDEYEKVIHENVKLKEQNDVQTKLWKIWLETHEKKTQVTDKTSEQQEKDNEDNLRKKSKDIEKVSEQQEREQNISETLKNIRKESEDEILLIEEDELSPEEVQNIFSRNKKMGMLRQPLHRNQNRLESTH